MQRRRRGKTMNARAFGLLLASLILGASGLLSGLAWSQSGAANPPAAGFDANPIGKVMTVTGSATIEHTTGVIVQANMPAGSGGQAKVGDAVYRGDLVQTGADGALALTFADGTSFKVSSNARMELNEYVYDPKGNSNSTLINLSKGTFTFLAGAIAKTGNMKVSTPVGTMGIRGTAPHVEILEDGTVKFSTLIEEDKGADKGATAAPTTAPKAAPPQRKAQGPMPGDSAAEQQAEKELKKKIKICQGC
jgi:hypothetical protein